MDNLKIGKFEHTIKKLELQNIFWPFAGDFSSSLRFSTPTDGTRATRFFFGTADLPISTDSGPGFSISSAPGPNNDLTGAGFEAATSGFVGVFFLGVTNRGLPKF